MNDLISRKALMESLHRAEEECENAMRVPSWATALYEIRHQPTVCNVDKVVEQLEEEISDYEKRYHKDVLKYNNVVHNATMQGNIHGLEIAIEIVKEHFADADKMSEVHDAMEGEAE